MYGGMLLFDSEFVHIVAISFTSLILTELLMVALTIQTWHWLMIVGELLSLSCYVASLVFLHEFIGEMTQHENTHSLHFTYSLIDVIVHEVGLEIVRQPFSSKGDLPPVCIHHAVVC